MTKLVRFAMACAAVVCGVGAEAAESSKVVTGGLRVTEWTVDAKGWWHAKLPVGTRSSHFFVNGQRRTRPKPLCAAGRTASRKLTKDLPPVPAVFDAAPLR